MNLIRFLLMLFVMSVPSVARAQITDISPERQAEIVVRSAFRVQFGQTLDTVQDQCRKGVLVENEFVCYQLNESFWFDGDLVVSTDDEGRINRIGIRSDRPRDFAYTRWLYSNLLEMLFVYGDPIVNEETGDLVWNINNARIVLGLNIVNWEWTYDLTFTLNS